MKYITKNLARAFLAIGVSLTMLPCLFVSSPAHADYGAGFTLSSNKTTVRQGDTYTITVNFRPEDGTVVTHAKWGMPIAPDNGWDQVLAIDAPGGAFDAGAATATVNGRQDYGVYETPKCLTIDRTAASGMTGSTVFARITLRMNRPPSTTFIGTNPYDPCTAYRFANLNNGYMARLDEPHQLLTFTVMGNTPSPSSPVPTAGPSQGKVATTTPTSTPAPSGKPTTSPQSPTASPVASIIPGVKGIATESIKNAFSPKTQVKVAGTTVRVWPFSVLALIVLIVVIVVTSRRRGWFVALKSKLKPTK
jgi:hypothetical protein